MQKLICNQLGKIEISELSEKQIAEDVNFININLAPPKKLTPDDVYIRECYLTGDAINCYQGRFRTKDLKKILAMTNGVALLVGHNKEESPVGKFFGGSVKSRNITFKNGNIEKVRFIVPKFYWMRDASNAKDLKTNIDGGIYNQASISWYYNLPTCSICNKDIRMCSHVPGQEYKDGICFYWYDEVKTVLEGSIVFAGGHPGTGFALTYSSDNPVKKRVISLKYGNKIIKYGIPIK